MLASRLQLGSVTPPYKEKVDSGQITTTDRGAEGGMARVHDM
jgi:hypothetical protein